MGQGPSVNPPGMVESGQVLLSHLVLNIALSALTPICVHGSVTVVPCFERWCTRAVSRLEPSGPLAPLCCLVSLSPSGVIGNAQRNKWIEKQGFSHPANEPGKSPDGPSPGHQDT